MARSLCSECGRCKSFVARDVGIKFAASVGCVCWSYYGGDKKGLERDEGGARGFVGEGEGGVCEQLSLVACRIILGLEYIVHVTC